jgi:hypothetical protein
MPRALSPSVRQAIWNRFQAGQDYRRIAAECEVSPRSVRRLIREVQKRGQQAFLAGYASAGVRRSKHFEKMRRRTLKLRKQHPRWGAGRLLLELTALYRDQLLPCERTLQRWLCQEQLPPARAGRPPVARTQRTTLPHEVWQIDAAEQKRLATGQMISWLRVADEGSGGVLKTIVFSRRVFHARATTYRSKPLSCCIFRVGTAMHHTRGQRCAVGIVERSPAGPGVVGHWLGGRNALESSQMPRGECCHRTKPKSGSKLGGTDAVLDRSRVPVPDSSGRSIAARGLPQYQRYIQNASVSRAPTLWPSLQSGLGTESLELGPGAHALGRIRRDATRGQLGQDWLVQQQTLRRVDL